ncbi:Retrovirus-related Pol polyprotein from transposon RE1 [Vitis vinifera]|uniref:Retrovirus-related Pol polyprotein from transposon RE1 n=1 Tax=Vitis vinifera TaxID=29760 RepID=A0A438C7D3_VITVI|nr:Retrovirus-related Pol polyprotein from transposon RE1 [Vitis vinifera]
MMHEKGESSMDQTKGSMQKEEMIVSKKMWTTLFPPSVDCRQGHQSSSEPLFLGKSSSFSEVSQFGRRFWDGISDGMRIKRESSLSLSLSRTESGVRGKGPRCQEERWIRAIPISKKTKKAFWAEWGPIFVVQQSQIYLIVQKSEVKDSSLRGFVKFREWKTWSKSKPSSPKKDSNLMTGSQGNTMVSPSGEFLIDGLSPRKMAKVRRPQSFRRSNRRQKTFTAGDFSTNFSATSFSDTARSAGGDLQFFPKHRSQKTTHAPAMRVFPPATASHAPAVRAREPLSDERFLLQPRLTPTSHPSYLFLPSEPARASFGVLLPPPPSEQFFRRPPAIFSQPNPCTCLGKCSSTFPMVPRENYLSWSASVELWFMGQGYEDHLVTQEADIPEDSPFFSTTSESLPVFEVLPLPIVSPSDVVPPRPLQVYHRRPRVAAPLSFAEAPADSLPIPSASPTPALPSPDDLPIAIGKSTHEALSHPGWRQAMVDEMAALHSNGTWDLVVLPLARLVAKGYTQVYGSDYGDTFSPVAKIASVRLLLSMAAMCSWPLYQLDIKKSSFMVILPRKFIWSNLLVLLLRGVWFSVQVTHSLYGLKQSPRAWFGRFVLLFKSLACFAVQQTIQFSIIITPWTKDLGKLKYFLGIEIAQSSSGVVLSQRKYALDILEETGMLDCKPIDTPMDPNVKLVPRQGEPLGDPGRYRQLVGKLNYLTITRPDISFPYTRPSVLYENRGHTQVVGYTDADWAGSPTDRRSTSGAEAEYRVMTLATCELIWLRHLLRELRFEKDEQMKLICDNQAALHIASNPVFHERTKHIEVDCHFIREKIASGCVVTSFVNSNDQLADIFTKSLRGPRIKYICNKLGAYDVYAPA